MPCCEHGAPPGSLSASGKRGTPSTRTAPPAYDVPGETRGQLPMRATTVNHEGRTEVTILARLLGMEEGTLPSRMARFIL